MLGKRAFLYSSTVIAFGFAALSPTTLLAQSLSDWETPEYRAGWQLGAVNAAEAYALGFTGKGVSVGVLDSGLDTRHPEFTGRVLDGYDFTGNHPIVGEGSFDTDTHGTHVSGIIAANRDGEGMHGVAFDAKVMPVVFDQNTGDPDANFATSWRFLADQGVSIVNNSLGINNCTEGDAPPCNVTDYDAGYFEENFPDTIAAMKYTAEKDVLMVFATGNESQPAPDALGGMPYWIPELRDNWITVGAVDSDGELASFSNRCGIAADWCLVAPGVEVYSTMPLGEGSIFDPNYMPEDGTSMATPVVSGIAALVKEAFPFFTAQDLQQTLLTTATSMGDPSEFGWGMVNAGKAVQGYGTFVSDVGIDTKGYDATFGNDIDGDGSLTKIGDGMLTMAGDNTYLGGTVVYSGGLSVDGTLSSLVYVGTDGTLRGTGTINAPLAVDGRLAPGNSPGTLTVAGPVLLSGLAVSEFDIDGTGTGTGAGNYARLVTTGKTGRIEVNGTLVAKTRGITGDATNTYVASLGTRFNIIRASAELTGSFDSLVHAGTGGLARATRFDAVYDASGVSVAVTPEAYGDLAANGLETTNNQDATGAALDAIRPTAGVRSDRLFSSLYTTDAGDLSKALGQLSGEIHASATALQVARSAALQDTVAERVHGARLAEGLDERATFWSSAYGGFGSADGGQTETFDWDTTNILFGLDMGAGEESRIGLAAGTGHSNGDVDDDNASLSGNHYDIVAYGSTSISAFDLSVGASHSWSNLNTARSPDFGGFSDTLTGSYQTRTAQVFGEIGYTAVVDRFELNPFVSGSYMAISDSRFAETGGAAALSGTVADRNLGLTVTGLRVLTEFDVGAGKLSTRAMLGWQHLHGNAQGIANVAFAGGAPFRIDGAGLARNALRIDLGADYSFSDRVTGGLGYRGTLAPSSSTSSITGNFKVAF
ncbi:autotransporter serine protease [Pararhizobium antarcticum]|uniref:Autotransporter domain-containing protein n=1 Tax=Pararhizobium antarcticum TaxID=1798805 RepID=A0A657LYR2_9HYPH|nr:autotransporter serine protease [Pararhizobium antarcticum]OJF93701.1 hypothetical protein AX761_19815 [Rhizobium sp. 58]OJG01571.1 hypothetical protein AX760_01280 [Pararhizobium antarcticum]